MRSQFDSSVPLQILAVDITFLFAYYVTFFNCESKENPRDFTLNKVGLKLHALTLHILFDRIADNDLHVTSGG